MTPTLLNNRYRILRTLGAGGFGNTFLAEDTYMPSGRQCVIKQLKPVTHDPQTYKLVQERFQREAAVLEELGEGNNQIPRLFAYFSETGQFYLVQEYIEGDTLTQKVERGGSQSESEVTKILVSLLPVLDYVHSRRMIHRDIKPDNVIMRQRDGLPVLIDFGAVKEAMTTVVNMPSNPPQSMVIGTPGFMPAEQAGGRPTYASDLYSLGLTAVFLLTGKIPQDLPTDNRTGEILWRQYAPNVNANLAMVLDRAIRFNASDRFSTAKEMLNALQSGNDISQMDTVAVAPGGLPHPPNRSTPPSPRQTAPVGTTPAIQGNKRNPLLIAALVAAGFLVAGVGIGLSLSRSPEPSPSVASNSESTSEQETSEQRTSSTNSRSRSSDSEPISEPPSYPAPSRRSQPRASEPSAIPPESASQRESQAPSQSPPLSSPSQPISVPPPERGNNQNSNQTARIPSFAPGTQQSYIKEELGKPTKSTKGLWNTRALLYEDYIPGQASLGYLYDPSSGRVRQTEISVAESVDFQTLSSTLDRILNNNASADIKQGLEKVYQNRSNRYRFVSGRNNSLKGVIERNEPGRIYIGVWEADLH
ncbi:MAG: serine/threonine-protein kinase [Cyanobacteriota bacterium]